MAEFPPRRDKGAEVLVRGFFGGVGKTQLAEVQEALRPGLGSGRIVGERPEQRQVQKWVTAQKALMVASAGGVATTAGSVATAATWTKAQLLSHGKTVFVNNCAVCHQVTGLGIPGTFPPLSAGRTFSAAPAMLQQLRTRGFLTSSGHVVMGPVKNHLRIVLGGIPGTPMPSFSGQLSNADIASVVTYERNSFGNHTGDIIQPSEVAALR